MKILFLIPYPLYESPSQRFRFEQYIEILKQKGYQCTFQSFLNSQNWQLFFKSGKSLQKGLALFSGFLRRVLALFQAPFFDFVFIHREAAPLGPPVFEWVIAKILHKKIIYDFDDAIWLTDRANESWLLKTMKWRTKVGAICKWSYKVSAGNNYLCTYAQQFNPAAVFNPTTIDTNELHNPHEFEKTETGTVTIGWTGSHSTLKYLVELEQVLERIEQENPFLQILVIANQPPVMKLKSLAFIPWSKQTETEDLLKIDIGIMPLPDDEWSKGKCGFKALQYMALEIPAVASQVGANSVIIDDGFNGYLCSTSQQWYETLNLLIGDVALRKKIGNAGREKVIGCYSVESNTSTFLSLFA